VRSLLAAALIALAAWPAAVAGIAARHAPSPPAAPVVAPVKADYGGRSATIAYLEGRLGRDPADALIPRLLSVQYLQRYREHADPGDVLRAERTARRSLAALPRGNAGGASALAAALTAQHRFREAQTVIAAARASDPAEPGLILQDAALALEVGAYERAGRLLAAARSAPGASVIASRFAEVTGSVAAARRQLDLALQRADSIYDTPAERRAWFHFRAGELAFLAGDNDAAIAAERAALAIYPDAAPAWNALARILLANRRYAEARDAAVRGAALVPSPETLGYASASLGDQHAAAVARDEIGAIARLGNAQRVSDRLLALYDADHGVELEAAYALARRELAVRNDVYAQDALAWTAAKTGRWAVARAAAAEALRFDTEDSRLQYHAAVIALHDGERVQARRRFERALALNPNFHPVDAERAREELTRLSADSAR
jgi:tetratricopeptide (TPR) repeat protein